MWKRRIFLAFVAISTISLLLNRGGHFSWNAFLPGCPALRSHSELETKQTNVAFLKTHKTASSTMQNLLLRFAERHNLTVALPVQACGHQFCYPQSFSARFVHPHTLPANIITNHMRFNRTEVQRLMPDDTVYVTVLREPGTMFESLFSYYNQLCPSFKKVPNSSLEAFLEKPGYYYRPDERESEYAHNTLTHDLGGDKDRPPSDEAYAKSFVEEVERVFSLVMITEYFDESLILLRHLLSWDLEDIVYLNHNMRTSSSKQNLTPRLTAKIRAWNSIDARLYDHFNASLWRQLAALGSSCVARELRLLRQAQKRLVSSCFGGQMPLLRVGDQIRHKELRPWKPNRKVDIVGYDLPANLTQGARELCLKLIMPEVSYTSALLRSQSISRLKSKDVKVV